MSKDKLKNMELLGSKEASKILGVHPRTLYNWESKGEIDTVRNGERGKRYYNVKKFLEERGMKCEEIIGKEIKCTKLEDLDELDRVKICYARVSSISQRNDLERQKKVLTEKYPENEMIEDI